LPITPYHFGPSGLIGYVFRKWIDFPVFVLANVIVDFEVLAVSHFNLGWPIHRYAHTFLIGALVGAAWGLVAFLFKPVMNFGMNLLRINYKSDFKKMLISGVLGVWLHVLIDGFYHYDVKPLWPYKVNFLWKLMLREHIKTACLICLVIFVFLYMLPTFKQAFKKR